MTPAYPTRAWFRPPFIGRVQPHFRTKPRHRRGEIEVVNRCVVHQRGVARRIHARRDRPDDFIPACVDSSSTHDDVFGVHELAQERPHAEHHAFGVTGVLFLIDTIAMRYEQPSGGR